MSKPPQMSKTFQPPRLEKSASEASAKKRARGPSPEKTEQTRKAIIRAALREFLEKGFAQATMEAVAKRACLAKGTSYRYFTTKEALFEGVVREEIASALADANPVNRRTGEKVKAFLQRTLSPAMRDIECKGRASIARLVLMESAKFPALAEIYRREMFDPLVEHARELAATAYETGELKNGGLVEFPQLLLAPVWYGIIHNGMLNRGGPLNISRIFEANLEILFPDS